MSAQRIPAGDVGLPGPAGLSGGQGAPPQALLGLLPLQYKPPVGPELLQ